MNIQSRDPGVTTQPLSAILGELAVLASIRASALGMTKLDKQASKDADAAHNAKAGTGKLSVIRLPGAEGEVDAIKTKARKARAILISYTTQWGEDRRLLPNQNIGDFAGEFGDLQTEYQMLVDQFVVKAPTFIQAAKKNLGSYNVEPPSEAEIRSAFTLGFELAPVPDTINFRSSDKSIEEILRKRFENDVKTAYAEAQRDALSKIADPLEKLIERMTAYEERMRLVEKGEDAGRTGTFTSTIITNLTDVGKVFRSFNLINDPAIEKIAKRIDEFNDLDHEDLKKDKKLRADVANKAAAIRKELGSWLD